MKIVRRDAFCTDGGLEGTITTNAQQIDGVARRAWMKIHKGNVHDAHATVNGFIQKYSKYIYKAEATATDEVDGEIAYEAFTNAKNSTGGMDGWEVIELALFSKEMCRWTAELYKLIENGAPWPSRTKHARIAYLEKPSSMPGEVMSYRPLTIMSVVYRRWASMRLKCLDDWFTQGAVPEMFAGVAQQGAIDAWYQVLTDIEEMPLSCTPYCGCAADIHKFFDHILRPMVHKMAEMVGMPAGVLKAYATYREAMTTYNTIAGRLGHADQGKAGIPLGCPFSMMIVALLMRP